MDGGLSGVNSSSSHARRKPNGLRPPSERESRKKVWIVWGIKRNSNAKCKQEGNFPSCSLNMRQMGSSPKRKSIFFGIVLFALLFPFISFFILLYIYGRRRIGVSADLTLGHSRRVQKNLFTNTQASQSGGSRKGKWFNQGR